ncbi:PGF-CTERM sorting domain-containing protein [Haladaptatus caseinilyticus]|uniref:PGF-CTERM sorting domain-containing protein n=1 Tax=Haladaptatus caseinilyticus TaxID=2993314 RepID=UPI00224AB3B9|nr:PGF-CTERM sorting domain-containing protein [Haladaptatus caseinilyticus]
MSKRKIVSIFLVGILVISAIGIGQASMPTKAEDKNKNPQPQKMTLQVEEVTVHNWSFTVGPDDSVDRTVYVDPISIKNKKYKVDLKKLAKADDMSGLATMPAKKQAQAQAKQNVNIKEGETVRICIKKIHIENVDVMVKLPKQMPNSKKMSNAQMASMDSDKPGYMVTINKLSINKWSFIVGPKKKPDETITIGDVTVKDRVIHVGSSDSNDEKSAAAMESIRKQIKGKMAEKGVKKGKTYRVIIQNINIENVTFVFGNPENIDVPEDGTTTTEETTTEEDTSEEDMTTTEEGDTTTTTTSSEGSNGDDGSETTNNGGQPGFGVGIALLALLGVGFLAVRRE